MASATGFEFDSI